MKTKILKILLILVFPSSGFGQYFDFPDTVNIIGEVFIHAKRDLNETGVKIQRIDSLIIQNRMNSDLSSLLSENTAVFIKSNGRGSMASASLRGTNSSHTQVLWNNIPLNSPLLGMVDMSVIPVSVADDVLLYYGPAAISKNSGALGGLIELNTKPDWNNKLGVKLVSSTGSYSSWDNSAEIKTGNNKIQSVSKFYNSISENDFTYVNNDIINGGIQTRKNADYNQTGFLQELHYRPGQKSNFSLKAWYRKLDRGIPGLSTNESGENNNISRENEENLILAANSTFHIQKSRIEINSGINLRDMNYNHKNYISGRGFLEVIDSDNTSKSFINSLNYKYSLGSKLEIFIKTHYNYHQVTNIENIRNEAYDTSRFETGIIAGVFFDTSKKIRLGAIARQDYIDNRFSYPVPSLLVDYEINSHFLLKSVLAYNSRHPSMNDLYFSPGGNPNLKNEHGWQYEIGINKSIYKKQTSADFGLTVFYNEINDWILWRPTNMGYWQAQNLELVVSKGVESSASLKTKISKIDFSSIINYSYTSSINKSQALNENDNSVNKQLPYIPLHSANIFVNSMYKNFYLNYQWNYYSERYTGSAAEPGILVSIYPYFMSDVSAGKRFYYNSFTINLKVSVYNLFDESYRSVLWQAMPGRNYRINLAVEF